MNLSNKKVVRNFLCIYTVYNFFCLVPVVSEQPHTKNSPGGTSLGICAKPYYLLEPNMDTPSPYFSLVWLLTPALNSNLKV